MWFAIQDGAAGRESRSAWIAMAAFWITAYKVVVAGDHWKFWVFDIEFSPANESLLLGFLGMCLGLYFTRRATDAWEVRGNNMGCQRPPGSPTPGPAPVIKAEG